MIKIIINVILIIISLLLIFIVFKYIDFYRYGFILFLLILSLITFPSVCKLFIYYENIKTKENEIIDIAKSELEIIDIELAKINKEIRRLHKRGMINCDLYNELIEARDINLSSQKLIINKILNKEL